MASSKYSDDMPGRLLQIAKDNPNIGFTNQEIGALLDGVTPRTIVNWMNAHPLFMEAVQEVKDERDAVVTNALFTLCKGFAFTETKIVKDAEGNTVRTETTEKNVPPSPVSCFFWLKNRQPDKWVDINKTEHTIKTITKAEDLSDDELAKIAATANTTDGGSD